MSAAPDTLKAGHRQGFSRRWSPWLFATIAMLGTAFGVVSLGVLLYIMASDGFSGLSWDFLTSFPSRKAEEAGILAALMGTLWVMSLTCLFFIPLGRGGCYIPGGIRKPQLVHPSHRNQHQYPGGGSICGLRAAGAGGVRQRAEPGVQHHRRRGHVDTPCLTAHHRGRPRRVEICAALHERGGYGAGGHQVAGGLAPSAALGNAGGADGHNSGLGTGDW